MFMKEARVESKVSFKKIDRVDGHLFSSLECKQRRAGNVNPGNGLRKQIEC